MNVLIAGGGIAGPVTALALQRAGIEASIFEAHPRPDPEAGSYFTVTANGLEALRTVDAMDVVSEAGFPTRRNVMWNHAGRRLGVVPLDSTLPGSPPALTMKRSRMASVLQEEAILRGIRVDYGRRLIDATVTSDGGVEASFADGGSETGDVLAGADGVHSVVRQVIDPEAPSGRYVGLTNFGGVTAGAAGGIEAEAWNFIFDKRAFFGYQATPAGDVVWFANVPRPMISDSERAATNPEAWKRQLIELFAGDDGLAAELIESGELELAADNTHDLGNLPRWHRGPMVVIGDAAHAAAPTSGQGASMAIEDSITLARALGEEPSIAAAFEIYEKRRRKRVEKVVAWGARSSNNKTPGPLGRVARDLMMPLVFRFMVTERSLAWMYDYRIGDNETSNRSTVVK